MPTTTMLDHALAYAARGWRVHPLRARDKTPASKHGCKDATTDETQIRAWWAKLPNANIGLATGYEFFAIDIDPAGMAWYEAEHLPATHEAVTGRAGRHVLYRMPTSYVIGNSAGLLAEGVDVRGMGGYIVAPPSVHPSGTTYTWLDCDGLVPDGPCADAPPEIVAALVHRPETSGPLTIPNTIKKGVQHRTLHSLASSLRAKGMEQPEIEAALIIAARRCEDVPPDSHMTRLAASVCKLYKPGLSPAYAARALEAVDFDRTTGWKAKLKVSESGKPKPLLMNADIALRHCPDWEGVFAFDEFRQKCRIIAESPIGGEFPRDWSDADDTRTAIWMQGQGVEVGRELVGAAVQAIATENPVHPLRDWLRSLRWDGEPRVDRWLVEYLGAASSDYVRSVGRMWLISAVARVMKPGAKVDHAIVLEARQGAGKSRALRILAGDEYFVDSLPDLHQKDAQMQTFGAWVI
ncbi:MAG: hypothetical protein FJW30_28705, partial [Acidobacteria bacterium]|nr:hypothetical protein [Acidobacteriota bacterium]